MRGIWLWQWCLYRLLQLLDVTKISNPALHPTGPHLSLVATMWDKLNDLTEFVGLTQWFSLSYYVPNEALLSVVKCFNVGSALIKWSLTKKPQVNKEVHMKTTVSVGQTGCEIRGFQSSHSSYIYSGNLNSEENTFVYSSCKLKVITRCANG